MNCLMLKESETRNLLEEINETCKENPEKKIPRDVHSLSCLLYRMLAKWISFKISTINLIIFGKVRKPSQNCESLARKNQQSSRNGGLDKLSCLLQSVQTDLITK